MQYVRIYIHHVWYVMHKVDWDNSWIVGAKLRSKLCVTILRLSVQSSRIAPSEVSKAWIGDQSVDCPDIQSSDCIQGKYAKCGLKLILLKLTRNRRVESCCLLKLCQHWLLIVHYAADPWLERLLIKRISFPLSAPFLDTVFPTYTERKGCI